MATGPRRGVQEQSSARTDEEAQESSFPTGQTTGSSEKDIQMGPNVLPCSCDFYTPDTRVSGQDSVFVVKSSGAAMRPF